MPYAAQPAKFMCLAGQQETDRSRKPSRSRPGGRRVPPSGLKVLEGRPSREFRREGDDLIIEHEITFSQAALGAIVDVPTIDGPLKIRIQPGIQPGTLIRLHGKGG